MKYGMGLPKDVQGGIAWYLKAAAQGDAASERELGLTYMRGEGVPQSDKDAFAWLYSSSRQDDPIAEYNLAYLYLKGRGVTRDDTAAFAWYYRSAQHNDAFGEWGVGYMYDAGLGVKKDYDQAMQWYRKAEVSLPKDQSLKKAIALANAEKSYRTVSRRGYIGSKLGRKDNADFLWVTYLAKGSPADQAGIKEGDCIVALNGASTEKMSEAEGYVFVEGEIDSPITLKVRRDGAPDSDIVLTRQSLLDTYSKAADGGDPQAGYWVGGWYESQTPKPDPAKAAEYYRKAADQGYAPRRLNWAT